VLRSKDGDGSRPTQNFSFNSVSMVSTIILSSSSYRGAGLQEGSKIPI
jgi:hypothetical protein